MLISEVIMFSVHQTIYNSIAFPIQMRPAFVGTVNFHCRICSYQLQCPLSLLHLPQNSNFEYSRKPQDKSIKKNHNLYPKTC